MKDTWYFSHDYNARADEKIKRLLKKHGMTGYGIFWAIVEDLYNNDNELSLDYDGIAYDLHHPDPGIIRSVINDFGLFIVNNGCFGSDSVERRLSERNAKSERARQKALKRWHKDTSVPDVDATALNNDATAKVTHAIKESKVYKEKNIKNIMSDAFSTDFQPEDIFSDLAFSLWKNCYEILSAKNIKPTILQKAKPEVWANEFRLIVERDKRTEAEIYEVLDFVKKNDFWAKNIQSPSKLREQFERLQLDARTPKRKRLSTEQDLAAQDYSVKPCEV